MKFGKLTPEKWGAFMPVHNTLAQKGPWYYRNTECVVFEFLTDPEYALSILPSDLQLYEPAMAVMVIETNHWTTIGPYSEVYNAILCKWKGEIYGYVPGVYVTGEASQIVGREIWGFGKKRAHRIEVIRHNDGKIEAAMDVKPGDRALRAMVTPAKNEPASAMGALPLICLRVIPDAEGGDVPTMAQLVCASFVAEPVIGSDGRAELYSGPGHLQFDSPSDALLPIQKIVSAKYALFNAVLPYGKVLKTFTKEELSEAEPAKRSLKSA